jgi:integrase
MLLRLLWCCGLRLSEALNLQLSDVDIDSGILTVRKAKYNQIRLVPMSESLLEYTLYYWNEMRFSLKEAGAYFLPTHRDDKYDRSVAARHIKKIMLDANVTKDGNSPPRVHDIRHSYAVWALKKMTDENVDIYCTLPMLSIFMGHSDIISTEYYLRLTGHVFPDIAAQMEPVYADVFPELHDEI